MSSGTQTRSVSSSVEVDIDAETAFRAFTEELDLWWVRGPINHHASGRAAAMRLEPGVGGRIMEVYAESAGEMLELARVVEWQPPKRLCWASSIDDVATEVTFEPTASGTLVRVVATIVAGGSDHGGTAWVRVVPPWFAKWSAERGSAPRTVRDIARLALTVSYLRPFAAARWLRDVFGFEPMMPLPEGDEPSGHDGHDRPWVEFRIGNSSLVVEPLPDESGAARPATEQAAGMHMPWVYVHDVEEQYHRARERGATIVAPLSSPWGLPFYVAADVEGHRWTFAEARPTMQ